MKKIKHILIADPDASFYDRFKKDPAASLFSFQVVKDGVEAEKAIREKCNQFAAVIVSPDIMAPSGVRVVKHSLMYQPSIPVVMLESMSVEMDQAVDAKSLGISRLMAKPFGVKEIQEIVGTSLQIPDEGKDDSLDDDFDRKAEVPEQIYRSIRADLFIPGSKSLFDIYVKLREEKYIKLFQAGDKFELDRFMEYINKGVKHFYILKEAQEEYIVYCDIIAKAIANKEKVSIQKKFGYLFNQAEMTMRTLYDLGIDNDTILYTQKYIKNVFSFVDQAAEESDFLRSLLKEASQFKHSTSVVVVASVISKQMGMETEKSVRILGTAALLHDVGLVREEDKDDLYAFNDSSKRYVDEEELLARLASQKVFGDEKNKLERIYQNHPDKGADMVSQIESIPAVVSQIIRQHHAIEQKEKGQWSGEIHPLAEVIEISDIFMRTIKRFQGESVDRTYLVKSFLELIERFPQRIRSPFLAAFKITK